MPLNLLQQRLVTVVVWKLKDPAGIEMRCLLKSGSDGSCELRVEWGNEVLTSEQHTSVESAFARADALWIEYLLDGWSEG
jgi:hypothetical protein